MSEREDDVTEEVPIQQEPEKSFDQPFSVYSSPDEDGWYFAGHVEFECARAAIFAYDIRAGCVDTLANLADGLERARIRHFWWIDDPADPEGTHLELAEETPDATPITLVTVAWPS